MWREIPLTVRHKDKRQNTKVLTDEVSVSKVIGEGEEEQVFNLYYVLSSVGLQVMQSDSIFSANLLILFRFF
jgi:hypothetical protein